MTYPSWHEVVSDSTIRQGDIFFDLPVPVAGHKPDDFPIKRGTDTGWPISTIEGNWVVFSASCDLQAGRSVRYPIIGRLFSVDELIEPTDKSRRARQKAEVLRRGLIPSKHLFADADVEGVTLTRQYADYRHHVCVPYQYLQSACEAGPRLRLKSPHREAFGNWVGNNFSRVGIEDDEQIPADNAGISEGLVAELN